MKRILISLLLCTIPFCSSGQTDLSLEPYFSAVIVGDIESSIHWYSSVLGFGVVNKVESAERGFKISNLKRDTILIELIELDKAVSPKEVIPDYTERTRLKGIFKVGFLVSNFDKWISHLTLNKVNFYGDVVTDKDGKKMVIVTDPDGNRIQIFEK